MKCPNKCIRGIVRVVRLSARSSVGLTLVNKKEMNHPEVMTTIEEEIPCSHCRPSQFEAVTQAIRMVSDMDKEELGCRS